jgi:hypothetical protein
MADSRYAIVVLSRAFFAKRWTAWELDGIIQRHLAADYPVIIPIWHDVDGDSVRGFSAPIANIVALHSRLGTERLATQLFQLLRPGEETPCPPVIPSRSRLPQQGLMERMDSALRKLTELVCEDLKCRDFRISLALPVRMDDEVMLRVYARCSAQDHDEIELDLDRRYPAKHSVSGFVLKNARTIAVHSLDAFESRKSWHLVDSRPRKQVESLLLVPIVSTTGAIRSAIGVVSFDFFKRIKKLDLVMKRFEIYANLAFEPLVSLLHTAKGGLTGR